MRVKLVALTAEADVEERAQADDDLVQEFISVDLRRDRTANLGISYRQAPIRPEFVGTGFGVLQATQFRHLIIGPSGCIRSSRRESKGVRSLLRAHMS